MEQDEEYGIVNEFFDYMDSMIEDNECGDGFEKGRFIAFFFCCRK